MKTSRDIIIQVGDLAAATHYYSAVLGLPTTHQSEQLVGFETGAFTLYVESGSSEGPVFEYLVADPQTTKEELLAAGCRVVEEDPSVPRCYLRDPFGLVFNLSGRSDEQSDANDA